MVPWRSVGAPQDMGLEVNVQSCSKKTPEGYIYRSTANRPVLTACPVWRWENCVDKHDGLLRDCGFFLQATITYSSS